MNTSAFTDMAELAFSAYGQFASVGPPSVDDLKILNGDLAGFSDLQAKRFRERFDVAVPTFNDATSAGGSGRTSFDVTVFKGVLGENNGKVFISLRGVAQKDPSDTANDLQAISDILINGAAFAQIVEMYNWWQRVSTPKGIDQPRYVSQFMLTPDGRGAVRTVDAAGTGEVAALIALTPGAKVTVTGSSLGGHLAMAFAALFPASTDGVVAFNSPGFSNDSFVQRLFTTLGGSRPAAGHPLITNVVSSEADNAGNQLDLIAGFPGGSYPGVQHIIPIENQYFSDVTDPKWTSWNHDQRQVTDALTVFNMLQRLDSSLTLEGFGSLLRAAAEGENRSLENLVDAVESFLGVNAAQMFAGNSNRDKLHRAVQAIVGGAPQSPVANAAFLSLIGHVDIHLADAAMSVAARTNFGALVALQELSPIWISGKDAAGKAALESIWQSTRSADYLAWQIDGVSSASNAFTDNWLNDRAALLSALALQNVHNNTTGQIIDPTVPGNKTYQFSYIGGAIPEGQTAPARHTLFSQRLPGQPSQVIFFGSAGNDVATGNGNAVGDHLYGAAGNDTLDGLGGDDYLEGGAGADTYIFNAAFGKDVVFDADGQGLLNMDNRILAGGKASGTQNVWLGEDGVSNIHRYFVQDNKLSSTGKQLVISRANDANNTITIDNFDLAAASGASGYLGIRLDSTQQLVLAQAAKVGPGSPFAAWNFNPNAFTGNTGIAEGGASLYTVFLRAAAKAGDTITLALSALGNQFKAILGGELVAASGAVLQLQAGQTEVSFALVQDGALSADGTAALSVGYTSEGSALVSNTWGLTLTDAGPVGRTMVGDGTYQVYVSTSDILRDGRVVVRKGENAFITDANGNLVAGAGLAVTSNVVFGTSLNDQVQGFSGNDAVDGGAGNDALFGNEGDDLIAGGGGNNDLRGGAGNDFILGAGRLSSALQQLGPNDFWQAPAGKTVLGRGTTWGVYQDAPDLVIWDGALDAGTGTDSSTIDAGDGDDHVIAGAGDDRISGAIGNDHLDGMGGSDVMDGGDGNDAIRADGIVKVGYLNTAHAQSHGKDFVDGGAGDDVVQGGGNADVLYGGEGSDQIFGDSGGRTDDEFFVMLERHGADFIDGEGGSDYLEGGGRDDTLYGGAGNDTLWGDTAAANIVANTAGQSAVELAALAYGNDNLHGEEGDDAMVGGGKDDSLYGGAGKDSLWGDESSLALPGALHGSDYLDGEADDDILVGGGRDDTLFGGDGADHLTGDDRLDKLGAEFHGDDYLDAEAGNDVLIGGGGADTLFGGAGNDTLTGDNLELDLQAAAFDGEDYLDGEGGDDYLAGGGKGDTLIGGAGNDTLDGGSGADSLDGGEGHDRLDGGVGADFMQGGYGDDSYVVDDPGDVVVESYGEGFDSVASSVDITLPDHVERLTLTGVSGISASGNDAANTLIGSEGADRIAGKGGNDTLNGGTGADTLTGGAGDDVYEVDDVGDSVVEAVNEGNDLVRSSVDFTLGAHTERLVTVGAADLYLGGNALDNDLVGNSGKNVLAGRRGNDYLSGGAGDDVYVFDRGDGQDFIDNTDLLRDAADLSLQGAVDTLRFGAGIAPADVLGWQSGDDVVLKIKGTTDNVVVAGYYAADVADGTRISDHKIDRVEFVSSVVWDQAMIQVVVDRAASNRAPGVAAGLPMLQRRAGDAFTYTVPAGTITDPDAGDSVLYSATMVGGGALPAWLTFTATTRTFSGVPAASDAGSLQIVVWGTDDYGAAAGNVLSLQVSPPNRTPLAAIPLVDKTTPLGESIYYYLNRGAFTDPDAGDTLQYSAALEDGGALPTWLTFNAVERLFTGTPELPSSVSVRVTARDSGNLSASDVFVIQTPGQLIEGTAGADVLTGGDGIELLRGMGGDDQISGGGGNDRLDGGAGNDSLMGGDGADTYLFGRDHGQDTINNVDADTLNTAVDIIRFDSTIVRSDLFLNRSGDDLVIEIIGAPSRLTVASYFAMNGTTSAAVELIVMNGEVLNVAAVLSAIPNTINGVNAGFGIDGTAGGDAIYGLNANGWERINGLSGNDYIFGGLGAFSDEFKGGDGDDVLDGRADGSPDVLYGGNGADRYVFGRGYGADVTSVFEYNGTVRDHIVIRSDISPADIVLSRFDDPGRFVTANDLLISINGTSDSLKVSGYFHLLATTIPSDYIQFSDGTSWGLPEVMSRLSLTGGESGDVVYGYYASNDVLSGGGGNDKLMGLSGNDTYVFAAGDDQDSIYDHDTAVGNVDTISFAAGLSPASVVVRRYGLDLELAYGVNDSVTAKNWYGGSDYQVEQVVFTDGGSWNVAQLVALANLTPAVINPINGQNVNEDTAWSFVMPSDTFADAEVVGAASLSYSASSADGAALPSWLGFDAVTRTFSGTPLNVNVGNFALQISATNLAGVSRSEGFSVSVANTNDAPIVASAITSQNATEDAAWSFIVPGDSFSDVDVGDALTWSAARSDGSALPSWLSFNAATRTFNGTPANANVGNTGVRVTAIDQAGARVSTSFSISITNTNDAPVLSVALRNQAGAQDVRWTYVVPAGTFNDADVGDTISYRASRSDGTALPSWLGFNAATRTFSGTPLLADIGNLALRVTASDAAGATVSSSFSVVIARNVAPVLALAPAYQKAVETRAYSYTVPAGTFTDADVGDVLTLSAKLANGLALPAWLSFNPTTRVFAGTPPNTAAGILAIQVKATDIAGAMATTSFSLDIANIVNGTAGAETLTGTAGRDAMYGLAGNDTLNGGTGADAMAGGAGDDIYVVDDAADTVVELTAEGTDLVQSGVSHTLSSNVENLILTGATSINGTGNTLANILTGNTAANTLSGGAGNDTIDGGADADTLVGGAGNDTYVVDNSADTVVELASEGTDLVQSSVSHTLATNVDNLRLTGVSAINGTGNTLVNILIGNAAANTLSGGAGNDTLDGGAGSDALIGGAGNDTYVVDNTADTVVELLSEGTDLVQSSVGHTLADNVENLTLTGADAVNGTGNALANIVLGNAGVNTLTGGAGNDTLNGGAGADAMFGGIGNDIYVVDNAADSVAELVSEGTDTVLSTISHTLTDNVENLTLTGTAATNGTGNVLGNAIMGNIAANLLTGGGGNDTLNGGAGADVLMGGVGNDIYVVDNAGDSVVELAGEGTDTIVSSISLVLADTVENLSLTGSLAINGAGNALANSLIGNSAANTLTGGAGNDSLNGGAGADRLIGGLGDDTYIVDNVADILTELAGEGVDSVSASVSYVLAAELENLTLTGSFAINATGNSAANLLTGNSGANVLTGGGGNDTLNGAAGADTLLGGIGDDLYVVDNAGDLVTELLGEGTDTVNSSVAHTLAANVEHLTLTGSASVAGTGNSLRNVLAGNAGANTLTGHAGDDVLDGRAGTDSLTGGAGDDTYWLARGYGADTVQENDATAGNTDLAQFDAGIATDQLWFRRLGNTLEVSIIGTSDKLSLSNWYLGDPYHVEQFKTSDGRTLLDSQVQNLVNAMAAFAPPAMGQTNLSSAYASQLQPVIAANWQ